MKRRHVILWTVRLLMGLALGFALRVVWERKPGVRFATGFALRSVQGPTGEAEARPSHLQGGVPVRFSLDEITGATEPAEALRAWREAFASAPSEARQHCLAMPVDASLPALRRCLTLLAKDPAFRQEISLLTAALGDHMPGEPDPDLLRRSLTELARMDAGLALDGAEASGDDEVTQAVWAVIAEDDPQRVLDLIASGQAPAERLGDALASLAARSPEAADAALAKLPEETQTRAVEPMARAMAATDPIKAIRESLDAQGKPDPDWVDLIAQHVPVTRAVEFLLAMEKDYPSLLTRCSNSLLALAGGQARHDPDFALAWFQRCVNPGMPLPSGATDLLYHVARSQPRAAAQALDAWPQSTARQSVTTHIVSSWMGTRPIEALDWMEQQPNAGDLIHAAMASPLPNPEAAAAVAEWFRQRNEPGQNAVSGYAARLARTWAAGDPAAASAWARTLSSPNERNQALSATWIAWMQSDPDGAGAELRDHAAETPGALLEALQKPAARSNPAFEKALYDSLPLLLSLPEAEFPQARAQLESSLASLAVQHDSRETALTTVAQLPDAASRERVLSRIGASRSAGLPLVQHVTSMMSDQAEAARLMEEAVRRAFAR